MGDITGMIAIIDETPTGSLHKAHFTSTVSEAMRVRLLKILKMLELDLGCYMIACNLYCFLDFIGQW